MRISAAEKLPRLISIQDEEKEQKLERRRRIILGQTDDVGFTLNNLRQSIRRGSPVHRRTPSSSFISEREEGMVKVGSKKGHLKSSSRLECLQF